MASRLKLLTSARVWLDRLDRSRHALRLLFGASMMETLFIPIPIETILIPWMLCHPYRKWTIAAVALAGNLAGAAIGYYLGVFAMELWGDTLISFFGTQSDYEAFRARFQEEGFVAIMIVGVLPIPFQIAMLVAGANGYFFPLFALAVVLSRGLRYFGLALLVQVAGPAALKLWERHAKVIGVVGLLVVGLWVWFELT